MANRQIDRFTPIIGLEIHVELKTSSKMFCGCKNDPFGAPQPNIYTCPVCLGLPGALPVPNKKAIEWTVMLGLALGCSINKESKFDRKHYFYPDLPKGYQISQYDQPFAVNGKLQVTSNKQQVKEIRIRRVHLEEDTAKMLHQTINGEKVSLIDFNRSSVPLVEIVTEPDIRSAEEAKEFAKKIHQIVRSLEISDADMEKGSMRLEANISLLRGEILNEELPTYKVELKNINSFRFLEKAINSELERQERLLSEGEIITQETRGWDSTTQTTKSQRTKEEAADYRYFPEADIPPIRLTEQEILSIKSQIPKMPEEVRGELRAKGVSEQAAEIIASDKELTSKVLEIPSREVKNFANWILHHQESSRGKTAKELIYQFQKEKEEIIGDTSTLEGWVREAIEKNPRALEDFRKGKESALQFLIGQVQKQAKGKANVALVRKMLLEKLS